MMTDEVMTTVMDTDKHATLISAIVSDLKDRNFLFGTKKYMDALSPEDKNHPDIKITIDFLNNIISNRVTEKKEALYYLRDCNYSNELKMQLDDSAKFTKSFKANLLTDLSRKSILSVLEPQFNKAQDLFNEIRMSGSDKSGVDAINTLFELVNNINSSTFKVKVSSMGSNLLIFDPISQDSLNTLSETIGEYRTMDSNRIKTIPVFDNIFVGGIFPGTLTLFAGITGGFKSGTLHQLTMYASKNNSVTDFDLEEGMKPCILFESLELTRRQILEKDLKFLGINMPVSELIAMGDRELEELIYKTRVEAGMKIPIVYSERLAGKCRTTVASIEDEINTLRNQGYQVVLLVVDYLDRMDVLSSRHQTMGTTGGDGSSVLQQKGKELRDFGIKFKIGILSAAQLNSTADAKFGECQAQLRRVDPLQLFDISMLSTSKALAREVEFIIYCQFLVVDNEGDRGSGGDNVEGADIRLFVSYMVGKDRDGNTRYINSKRDRENASLYGKANTSCKNDGKLTNIFKLSSRYHCVIPFENGRLSEDDYAKSIRMYYPTTTASYVPLNELVASMHNNNPGESFKASTEMNAKFDELIDL